MAYELVWKDNGVEMIYSGVLTDMDIISSNIEVVSSKNFRNLQYQICDLQGLTSYPISSEIIKQVAIIDNKASLINPNIHVAIIGSTIIAHGIAKMYQNFILESEWDTEFFEDRSSARKWLKNHSHSNTALCC